MQCQNKYCALFREATASQCQVLDSRQTSECKKFKLFEKEINHADRFSELQKEKS